MHELFQLLEYNFWANDQIIGRLQDRDQLSPQIEKQFSHILNAQKLWIGRVNKNIERYDIWQSQTPADWEGLNIELFHKLNHLLKSYGPSKSVRYQNAKQQWYENSLGEILYHLINHGTHHRAQLSLLMRQQHLLPPQTDFIHFLRR